MNCGEILTFVQNYCSTTKDSPKNIAYCRNRENGYVFDPIQVWHLNSSAGSTKRQSPIASAGNGISNGINNTEAAARTLFGDGVANSLKAYQTASKWMAIAFQIALWTNVATAITGILAIFSRWGSFITWVFAIANSFFTFAASLTATIIFGTLVGALKLALNPYKVEVTLGGKFLAYSWIATALSIAATSFWLFSVCCRIDSCRTKKRCGRTGLSQSVKLRDFKIKHQTGGWEIGSKCHAALIVKHLFWI